MKIKGIPRKGELCISLYLHPRSKGYSLSIDDENGGYRISGMKFDGTQQHLYGAVLDASDVREIRRYLDKYFPNEIPKISQPIAL